MRKLTLLLIASLFIATISCKKDDPPSKKDLLTANSWILVAETVSPAINFNGTLVTDLFAQQDACTKDDIVIFNAVGTYTFEEGATKCDINDPQVWDAGTWVFNSDQTVLVMTSPSIGTVNAQIKELSSGKLVIERTENYDGINYTITDTYQKK